MLKKTSTYKQSKSSFEPVTDTVSQTTPDMAYTIRELLDASKHNADSYGLYLGENDDLNQLHDLPTKELTDQMDALMAARENVFELKSKNRIEYMKKLDQYKKDMIELKQSRLDLAEKSKGATGEPKNSDTKTE